MTSGRTLSPIVLATLVIGLAIPWVGSKSAAVSQSVHNCVVAETLERLTHPFERLGLRFGRIRVLRLTADGAIVSVITAFGISVVPTFAAQCPAK